MRKSVDILDGYVSHKLEDAVVVWLPVPCLETKHSASVNPIDTCHIRQVLTRKLLVLEVSRSREHRTHDSDRSNTCHHLSKPSNRRAIIVSDHIQHMQLWRTYRLMFHAT
jgi:hypothetical protein